MLYDRPPIPDDWDDQCLSIFDAENRNQLTGAVKNLSQVLSFYRFLGQTSVPELPSRPIIETLGDKSILPSIGGQTKNTSGFTSLPIYAGLTDSIRLVGWNSRDEKDQGFGDFWDTCEQVGFRHGITVYKPVGAGKFTYLTLARPDDVVSESELQHLRAQLIYLGEVYHSALITIIRDEKEKKAGLTWKEKRILALSGEGKKAEEIADQINLAKRSVETYRNNIVAKMEAKNLSEAYLKAMCYELL